MDPPLSIEDLWKEAEKRFSSKTEKHLKRSTTGPANLDDVLQRINQQHGDDETLLKRDRVVTLVDSVCQCIKLLGGIAAKAASSVFAGADLCFQALGFLLDIPKRISEWYDDLEQLFFEIMSFLQQFKIYKRIEDFTVVDQDLITAINKVLICFVDICALSITILSPSKRTILKVMTKKALFAYDSGVKGELNRFKLLVNHQSRINDAITLEHVLKSQHDSSHASKELLLFLQGDIQIRDEKLKNVIDSVQRMEIKMEKSFKEQKRANDTAQIQDMLNWLSASNAYSYYEVACDRHVDGTGSWLLNSFDFRQWRAGNIKGLLLHGVPGSGKTVLTSTAVTHVEQSLNGDPNQNLSYFFFKIQARMGVNDLLAHLIRSKCNPDDEQLRMKRQTAFLQAFRGKYLRGETLREDDLWKCFESMVAKDKTYIIIDALDECGKTRDKSGLAEAKRKVMKMVERFWHMKNLLFLVSCRDGPFLNDIQKLLTQLQRKTSVRYAKVSMRKDLVNKDINVFVQQRLNENLRDFLEEYSDWREKIQAKIKPDGMFLLVARQLDLLEQRVLTNAEWHDVEKALDELPEDINGVYGLILNEIPQDKRLIATTVLKWLLTAQRPLQLLELKELISGIHKGPFNVLDTFSSLLVRHKEENSDDQQVLWAHDTSIREYLTGKHSGDFHIDLVEAHKTFAKTCVYYLKIQLPSKRHDTCDANCTECPRYHRFLQYATDNWYKHALFITAEGVPKAQELMAVDQKASFHKSARIFWLWLQVVACIMSILDTLKLLLLDKTSTGAISSTPGLSDLSDHRNSLIRWCQSTIGLIDGPITTENAFQRHIRTAAIQGYKEVTRLLLLHGSPVESSFQSYDALMAAATQSFTALLAILLEVKSEIPLKTKWWTRTNSKEIDDPRNEDLVLSICQLLLKFEANPRNKNKFSQTALHLASGYRYGKVVRGLVSKPEAVNDTDYSGSTALHFAAASGSLEVVKVLISLGANVNAKSTLQRKGDAKGSKSWNRDDFKAVDYKLIQAAQDEKEDEVIELIRLGANVRVVDQYGSTPLHWTSCRGAIGLSKLLIEKGADPNAARTFHQFGKTPLIEATRNAIELPQLVQSLIQAGADPNVEDSLWFEHRTALHEAAMRGREDLVKILLEAGANANARDLKDRAPADLARENNHEKVGAILDRANSGIAGRGGKGETPLHMACANNHYKVVEELLNGGANINARADNGWTVLHAAAMRGSRKLFDLLLLNGAAVDGVTNMRWSVLHEAANKGNVEVIKLLLEHPGVDQEAKDTNRDTPIMTAARASQEAAVRIILQQGKVHADRYDWRGHTPLHEACLTGHVGIVKLLLARPEVNVNGLENHYYRTPLMHAAREGHMDIVRLLMDKGANANVVDTLGWTPLSMARSGGHERIADLLVKHGGTETEPPEDNAVTPSPPPPYTVGVYEKDPFDVEISYDDSDE